MTLADSLTRAQCKSRSGVTPSKARAPSNTDVHNQAACVRTPMIGRLPSCQSSSKNVSVCDQVTERLMNHPFAGLIVLPAALCHHRRGKEMTMVSAYVFDAYGTL